MDINQSKNIATPRLFIKFVQSGDDRQISAAVCLDHVLLCDKIRSSSLAN
jgi:hypothetical protein